MAGRKQMLIDAAEMQEASGDAIEGVWLRRLASLVEHKGEAWMLRSLGGERVMSAEDIEFCPADMDAWLVPNGEG